MGKMSREDLFREIGQIDEAYVEEARRAGRKHRMPFWVGSTLVAAASLVFCVGVGYMTVLLTQPKGSTGSAMDNCVPGAGGSAMEAAQEQQYSVTEDTGGQMAGSAAAEEGAAEKTVPEAVPEEAPAQHSDDRKEFPETESRGQEGLSSAQEIKEDASDIKDTESLVEELLQSGSGAMELPWEAARTDAVYGRYVDVQVPEGYNYTGGIRSASALRVTWSRGMEEISVTCRQADEGVSDWLVDVEKPEEYDLGLYTIPWCDSVPLELYTKVSNATFRPKQITPEIVAARTYQAEEAGDVSGSRTQIGILYSDNVLVEISSKGPTAEEIYALINLENQEQP